VADADRIAAALRYQQELDAAQRPATMNPNLAAQGQAYRANMTPPTSVMDPRYPAWKQNQDAADAVGAVGDLALSAIPMAGPAMQGVKAAGRFAGPELARGLENYMGRTGMQLSVAPKAIKDLMPTEYKSAMSIEPPHNVRDAKKLLSLTESMKNTGWQGRPILTYDVGRGEEALTGSHRIKAAREANIEVPIYRIENAGDYVDKNGKSIVDVGFMELDDQVKWLNKFGDKNAAKLLKQEPEL
jgi:hypothetical protein